MMTNVKITGGVPGWDSGLYTLQPNSGQWLLFQGLCHSKPTSSPICYTETGPLSLSHKSMLPLKDIEMESWAFLLSCSTPSLSVCWNLCSTDLCGSFFPLFCFDPQLWSSDWEALGCSSPKLGWPPNGSIMWFLIITADIQIVCSCTDRVGWRL